MSSPIDQRFTTYRRAHGLTVSQAVRRLVSLALDMLERHRKGGHARAAKLSRAERQAQARHAAAARWAPKGGTAAPKGG